MILFLTSSPCTEGECRFTDRNRFEEELGQRLPWNLKLLVISSDPDNAEFTDSFAADMAECLYGLGYDFENYSTLDSRNWEDALKLVRWANLIILAGGHVPTENAFFRKINLRHLLEKYRGVVLGISAGTMNSADTVYAMPELEGEAADPDYDRYLTGLNLTKAMIVPHYNKIKDDVLDGMKVIDDILLKDSMDNSFFVFHDGTYLFSDGEHEEIRGEAYLAENGKLEKICEDEETVQLEKQQ